MGSILVVFAGALYFLEAKEQMRSFDQRLYDVCQFMAAGVEDGNAQNRKRVDLEDVPILGSDVLSLDTALVFARWYSPEGELVQFFGDIPPSQLKNDPGFQTTTEVVSPRSFARDALTDRSPNDQSAANAPNAEAHPIRLRQLTLPVYQDRQLIGYLQVAVPLTPIDDALAQLRWFLVFGVPSALAAIGFTGWVLGGLAMQPIRQSYDQLQRFTSDASHELRAPLAAIVNNAQAGLIDLTDPLEQQLRLEKIIGRAESMGILIGHLLFLARHEGPLNSDSFSSVNLTGLLRSIAEDYRQQATDKGLNFSCELPDSPLMVNAEPNLLRQSVVNLLSNAIRYTPEGGSVTLTAARQAQRVMICVEDTGVGISAEDLPHIFERFYRADKVRSRYTGGFGLGLAITQHIIEAHGGEISVKSQLEQGSCFQILL
ncbi:MAG TPA: ATP-binding protein [Coleofasciculaceae cyanobacterium]|jgi:signal transduction histidine kinase